jgi:hypothetical protein
MKTDFIVSSHRPNDAALEGYAAFDTGVANKSSSIRTAACHADNFFAPNAHLSARCRSLPISF